MTEERERERGRERERQRERQRARESFLSLSLTASSIKTSTYIEVLGRWHENGPYFPTSWACLYLIVTPHTKADISHAQGTADSVSVPSTSWFHRQAGRHKNVRLLHNVYRLLSLTRHAGRVCSSSITCRSPERSLDECLMWFSSL